MQLEIIKLIITDEFKLDILVKCLSRFQLRSFSYEIINWNKLQLFFSTCFKHDT